MGKKAKETTEPDVEAASPDDVVLEGDKTRCGNCANVVWSVFIFLVVAIAVLAFLYPFETYSLPQGYTDDDYKLFDFGKMGLHAKYIEANFDFHIKKEGNMVTFNWLLQAISTFNGLLNFIMFTIFPGWAYKVYFFGGAKSCKKIPINSCCATHPTAGPEQSHQADQMGRLLGIFIGLTFGIINFFTRVGTINIGDGTLAHMSVWFMVFVYHLTSVINKAAVRCFSIFLCISSLVLCLLLLLSTEALNDDLKWSLNNEMGELIRK
jgi:hypothetical protein